jgi:ribose-phosphate pyrophosphokinase
MYTIIAGSRYQELGKNTYRKAVENLFYGEKDDKSLTLTEVEMKTFKDGEMSPLLLSSVRDKTVFIILSTDPKHNNMMELFLLADACKESACKEVIAVVPYLGYCRQDRKNNERTSIGVGLVGRMLRASRVDKIVNLDLHAIQIQSVFSSVGIQSSHLEGHNIFVNHIKNLNLPNLSICSPDTGGIGRARALQQHFPNAPLNIINKVRLRANEVGSMKLIGNVEGQDVIIVDDIIDTGGTLCKAADYLMELGANSVRAVITHPLMSGDAYVNLTNSGITELITTNSISDLGSQYKGNELLSTLHMSKISVVDISSVLGDVIYKIIQGDSVSRMNEVDYVSVKEFYGQNSYE